MVEHFEHAFPTSSNDILFVVVLISRDLSFVVRYRENRKTSRVVNNQRRRHVRNQLQLSKFICIPSLILHSTLFTSSFEADSWPI
jgi:hypothetical protein